MIVCGRKSDCLKKETREVLGVSRGNLRGHKKIYGGMERSKKKVKPRRYIVYMALEESLDDEDERRNRERYKTTRRSKASGHEYADKF